MITARVIRISHPRAGLRAYARRMSDFRPAWNRAADDLADHFGQVFASEGGAIGRRFVRLRRAYEIAKARTHPGHPILTREGDLRNSLAERSAPNHYERLERQRLDYGTTDPKAHAHHYGRSAAGLRARPFMRFNRRVIRVVKGRVADRVTGRA